MKHLLLLLIPGILFGADTPSIDKTREYLDDLKDNPQVKEDNYEYPYLTVTTARLYESPHEMMTTRLQKQLQSIKTEVTNPELPKVFTTGEQLTAVEECNVKKCNVKLVLAEEAKKLSEAKKDARLKLYQQMVDERFTAYFKSGLLKGYEDRENNDSSVIDIAKGQEFLKFRYPGITQFLVNKDWKNRDKIKKGTMGAYLTDETVVIAPDKLQPIWRLGEMFEFNEGGSDVFVHLHVYTNHYFDSSLTFFEVIPLGTKSIVIVTDVLEVDELKKSGFIRALFKGKMVDAVSLAQETLLKKL